MPHATGKPRTNGEIQSFLWGLHKRAMSGSNGTHTGVCVCERGECVWGGGRRARTELCKLPEHIPAHTAVRSAAKQRDGVRKRCSPAEEVYFAIFNCTDTHGLPGEHMRFSMSRSHGRDNSSLGGGMELAEKAELAERLPSAKGAHRHGVIFGEHAEFARPHNKHSRAHALQCTHIAR